MALSNADKFSKEQIQELDRLNQEAVKETNERLEKIEKMDIRIDKRIKDSDDAFEEAMREQEERDETAKDDREENNKLLKTQQKVITGITGSIENLSKKTVDSLKDGFTEFLKSPAGIALGIVLVAFIAKNIVDPVMNFLKGIPFIGNKLFPAKNQLPKDLSFVGTGYKNDPLVNSRITNQAGQLGRLVGNNALGSGNLFTKNLTENRGMDFVFDRREVAIDTLNRRGYYDEDQTTTAKSNLGVNRERFNAISTSVNKKRADAGLNPLSVVEAVSLMRGDVTEDQLLDRDFVKKFNLAPTNTKIDLLNETIQEGFANIGSEPAMNNYLVSVDSAGMNDVTPE